MKKKREAKKRKVKRKPQVKVVQLVMDRDMKERIEAIAVDALTDVPTVCQVLLATGVHMGRNAVDTALREATQLLKEQNARVMTLQSFIGRCRTIMEANDPGNARELFGEPLIEKPEGAATVP